MNLDIMSLMAASAALSDPQAGAGEGAIVTSEGLDGASSEADFSSILQSLSAAIENVDESLPGVLPEVALAAAEVSAEVPVETPVALPEGLESVIGSTPDGNLPPENGNDLPLAAGEPVRITPRMGTQDSVESPALPSASTSSLPGALNPGITTLSASALAGEQGASAAGWFSQRTADDPRAPAQWRAAGVPVTTDAPAQPGAPQSARTQDAKVPGPLVERGTALATAEPVLQPKSAVFAERLNVLAAQSAALSSPTAPADPSGADLSRLTASAGPSVAPASTSSTVLSAAQPLAAALNINQAGWDKALGQRLVFMAANGLDSAELRLDPPQLGTVHVKLSMQGDQAQVVLQAANPLARDAMESALPRLRDMLGAEGLALDSAQVSDRDSGNRQRASDYGPDAPTDDAEDETAETRDASTRMESVETLTSRSGGISERV